jgi:Domain of unknown function (DUF4410)
MTMPDSNASTRRRARRNRRFSYAVATTALLCASVLRVEPAIARDNTFERVVVEVVSDGDKKSQSMVDRLAVAIVTKLRETGSFKRVAARGIGLDTEFDLVVTVAPGDIRNADKGAYWVGVFAGRSKIDVVTTLTDGVSGETLGEQEFNAESKLAATIFSHASAGQAIDGIATQVAAFVQTEVERRQP